MFESPKWDDNKTSDKLSKQLFGSKSERKKRKLIGTSGENSVSNTKKQGMMEKGIHAGGDNIKKKKKIKKSNAVNGEGKQNVPQNASPKMQFVNKANDPGTKSPLQAGQLSRSQKRKLKKKLWKERKAGNDQSDPAEGPQKAKKVLSSETSVGSARENGLHADKLSKLSRLEKKIMKKKSAIDRMAKVDGANEVGTDTPGNKNRKKRRNKNNTSLDSSLKKEDSPTVLAASSKKSDSSENKPGMYVSVAGAAKSGGEVSKSAKRRRRKKNMAARKAELRETSGNTTLNPNSESAMLSSKKPKKRKHVSEDNNVTEPKRHKNINDDDSSPVSPKKKKKEQSAGSDDESVNRSRSMSDNSSSPGEKKKRRRKKKKNKKTNAGEDPESSSPVSEPSPNSKSPRFIQKLKDMIQNLNDTSSPEVKPKKKGGGAGNLRERMMNQLKGSRFRFLNEQLYTCEGKEALKLFRSDPDAFKAYHEGYQQQVAQWPLNPVDKIIKAIKKKPENLVVADFGCGDGKLGRSVPQTVHSFDLVALSEDVTVCDMTHTPLDDGSVDIAVFCLSLMGTNLSSYILEANRVLKEGGLLKIAEVESRFEDVDSFIKDLTKYGFHNTLKDLSHNLFYFLDFKKQSTVKYSTKLPQLTLKPCLYKKR